MSHPPAPVPPTVSVVIPTYNHRDYVLPALDSVFAQTFTGYEVIVVNDGSPDDTAARLQPLARDGRIRYIEQPNFGQSSARNRGLQEARGEFIAFLDDDDLWPPDKLAWQVAALREHPDWAMVSGLPAMMDEAGTRQEPEQADGGVQLLPPEALFQGKAIYSPGQVLIRRTALDAVGGFDPAIWGSDDTDLWIRLAAHRPAALVRRCALYYRLHATNASRAASRMFWNSVRVARKNLPLLPHDRRAFTWRGALRDIYVYSGTRVVCSARDHGGARALWQAAQVLCFLAPSALRDPELAKMIGRDVLPGPLRRRLRGGKPLPVE